MKKKKGTRGKTQNRSGQRGQDRFSYRQRQVESEDMKSNPTDVEGRGRSYNAHSSRPNDPRWYAQNEQLMRDYASYPFADPLGTIMPPGSGANFSDRAVPGIMAVNFVPSIGYSQSEVAPINVAMRRLYSFVRHANSGASNYDAPDLMMYVIAVDSAMMYLSYLKRLYGVMLDYTPFNRYYPRDLILANGCDFSSLEENLNDLRGYINQYAVKLSQLWIPNSMSYMARHTWMCEGMYVDSNGSKAQTYMYVPKGFYIFTLDDQGAGSLVLTKPTPAQGYYMKYSDLITFGNSILEPLIKSEDFGIMGGDILKAFGESGIVKPQGIIESYQVLPVYSTEVLSQIENASAYGTISNANITQTTSVGTGYLVSTPTATQSFPISSGFTISSTQGITNIYNASRILNMHIEDVSPSDVMVATRLMNIGTVQTAVVDGPKLQMTTQVTSAASEIVESFTIYYHMRNSSTGAVTTSATMVYTHNFADIHNTGSTGVSETMISTLLPVLSQFDWHPIVDCFHLVSSDGKTLTVQVPQFYVGDIDKYTFINKDNLNNMSLTALLSELTVPQI